MIKFNDSINYIRGYFKNLFPGTCLLCQATTGSRFDLCEACQAELPYLEHACIQCALPLPVGSSHQVCGTCLQQAPSPAYRIFSTFIYRSPIDRLITSLKFKHQLAIARILGHLMANRMQQVYQNRRLPSYIIPVPLHSTRLRERGFNQALELARPISRALSIPLDYHSCTRARSTQPQTNLYSVKDRANNVRNAFTISEHFHADHICLIDDVLTTGHTALALSKVLLKAGVQSIDIWCCARAGLQLPVT